MRVYVRQAETGVPLLHPPDPEACTARCDLMLTCNVGGGSPERPAASDTLDVRLRTVFRKTLRSLSQELFPPPPLKKHVHFSRNLIPGVPTPSHLHQLKWHF